MSKSPEEIRQSAAMTAQKLEKIDNLTGEAFNKATDLLDDITCEEHPEAYRLLQQSLQTLKRTDSLLSKVNQLNIDYHKSANVLEKAQLAEVAKSSSNDLDQLVEQVKAAMAGADPGTDVVFVVRKEDCSTKTTLAELGSQAIKEYADAKEAQQRIKQNKLLRDLLSSDII